MYKNVPNHQPDSITIPPYEKMVKKIGNHIHLSASFSTCGSAASGLYLVGMRHRLIQRRNISSEWSFSPPALGLEWQRCLNGTNNHQDIPLVYIDGLEHL